MTRICWDAMQQAPEESCKGSTAASSISLWMAWILLSCRYVELQALRRGARKYLPSLLRGRKSPTWEHRLFLAACFEHESSSDSESLLKMVQMARHSSSSFSTCCCWSSGTENKDPEQRAVAVRITLQFL